MVKRVLKLIYCFLPFKKYLFLFVRKVCSPSRNTYQHLSFQGLFSVKLSNSMFKMYNTGTMIENQLFWEGINGFEPNSLKIWIKLCRISKVILDLGANTGIYSLIAKSENPASIVYAFEPVERVYKVLEKNLFINDFNVTLHKKAVSNSDGMGMFYDDREDHQTSVVINLDRSNEEGLYKVETQLIKLDTFIKSNNIQEIDLIKMDVELHEPEVIEGFKEYLEEFKPTFIIEVIRDYIASSLQKQLSELGYIYFYINDNLTFGKGIYETESLIYQRVDSFENGKYGNYLVCSQDIAVELNLI